MSGKFALIIGNTEYTDPGLAKLSAPGRDAEDFARILQDRNSCAFDEVKILINQISSSVIEAIDEFFDQRRPEDLLLLYYSGHGMRDELGSLYLAFQNTIRSRLRSTAIKSDYIREVMDQSRSRRQVLILDCCNSGAFPQGTKADVGGPMGMTTAFQGYGRYVLTASDATQFAWEGDRVIGTTENSLFTHFLVKGLEGEADHDGDGTITVDELYDYAFEEISKVTPKQTPTKSASKQEGDVILRRITRLEDIRPVSLPDELVDAVADSRTFVREGAVEQLERLLKGRNLGLARSARAALEKMAREDDSLRVRQASTQALKILQERLEAERVAAQPRRWDTAEAARKSEEEAEQPRASPGAEGDHVKRAKLEVERVASTSPSAPEKAGVQPRGVSEKAELKPESGTHEAVKRSILPGSPWRLAGMAGAAIVVLGVGTALAVKSLLAPSTPVIPTNVVIPTEAVIPTDPGVPTNAVIPTNANPTAGPATSLPFTTSFEDLELSNPTRIDPFASVDASTMLEPFSFEFGSYTPWRVDSRAHSGKVAINAIPFGNPIQESSRAISGAVLEPLFMTGTYNTVVLQFWLNTTSNPRPASIHNCDSSLNIIYRIDRSSQWQHKVAQCGQYRSESTGWYETTLTFDVANKSTIEFAFFYGLQNNVNADPSAYYLIDDLSVTGQ